MAATAITKTKKSIVQVMPVTPDRRHCCDKLSYFFCDCQLYRNDIERNTSSSLLFDVRYCNDYRDDHGTIVR